jgi:anaerobic selenocysteine-containing dehydrogenase
VLAALGERRGPERLLDLALRSGPHGDGFGQRPGGLSLDTLIAAPAGLDLGPLQPRLPALLRTPSGRIEAAPPLCLADLPRAWAALNEPAPAFSLIGRREVRSNNSWMHNLPLLAKGPERCTLLMHPSDAARVGLADGHLARISLDAERWLQAPVSLSQAMMPGVVSLPHGWGHDLPGAALSVASLRPGVNLNAVLDERLRDPLSGNAVLSGVAVQVAPA